MKAVRGAKGKYLADIGRVCVVITLSILSAGACLFARSVGWG